MPVRAPERPGQIAGTNPPIDRWSILAREPVPLEGVDPLDWVLYSGERAEALEEASMRLMDYRSR